MDRDVMDLVVACEALLKTLTVGTVIKWEDLGIEKQMIQEAINKIKERS